jgi:hypothetical protein
MTRPLGGNIEECKREHDKATIRCDTKRKIVCFVSVDDHISSFFRVNVKDAKAYLERKCRGE